MALVYLHTNKITNQKYVGISNYTDPNKRWRDGKGYETQYFGKAGVAVFGWDGFEHKVLAENIESEIAATLESLLIKKLESANPKYGYNTSEGKIFPERIAEAKNILDTIIHSDPYVLDRTRISEEAHLFNMPEISLDPPVIKMVKAGLPVSLFALGSVTDYFDTYPRESCFVPEKSNTSFLLLFNDSLAFIDKGEVHTYPFESTNINGIIDKWDDRGDCWKYKSVEVIDSHGIKPTLIISGTIANMKEFPFKLIEKNNEYYENIKREEERKRKEEADRLARIERDKQYVINQEKEKQRQLQLTLAKQEKIARRAAWFKKYLHINI